MKKLLILGAGLMQKPAFMAANDLGLSVVAIDPNPEAESSSLADYYYCCDLADYDFCLSVARRHRVDGVMTLAADYPIPALAVVCESLGLAGLGVVAARLSTHKGEMRKALHAAGIPVPIWYTATNRHEVENALHKLKGGLIIKPVDSSGGRGITFVNNTASAHGAFERALSFSKTGEVLIEEFVEGREFSIEAITYQGETKIVSITDKLTSGPPYFVEIGHSQPTQMTANDIALLEKLTKASLNALGIDNSPSHTEIRLGPQGPCIMEVGARLGGGFISSHLVPLSTGVDLVKTAVSLALGEQPELNPNRQKGVALRFLTADPGRVCSVVGVNEAWKIPGVEAITIYVKPGDQVQPLMDATARIGYVICSAPNVLSAIENVEKATHTISIHTD